MNNYEFCASYIKNNVTDRAIRVLDYGCGSGHIVMQLREIGIDANGCDVFYGGGDYSTQVPAQLFGSIIKPMENGLIPFGDGSFDFVVNNQVLEHVEDIDFVLGEIYRVLKPNGQVLSLFPDKSVWREGHCGIPFLHWFAKGTQVRVYYAAFLRAMGFGYHKGEKSIWQWSQDFCEWLDQWTWYRSNTEIRHAFDKHFINLTNIEDIWLKDRLEKRFVLFAWLPKWLMQLFVRKLGGQVFVCTKKWASVSFVL
jgi:SAM-dependent methyltransferase